MLAGKMLLQPQEILKELDFLKLFFYLYNQTQLFYPQH